MINLNDFRKNIWTNAGIRPCPGYGEDGVLKKIFELIGVSKKPLCIEFGELRVLGTTSRQYRISNLSSAVYVSATMDFKSLVLNILDILKISMKQRNIKFLKFVFSMPKKRIVTPDNVLSTLRISSRDPVDLLVVDIDSFDFEVVSRLLDEGIMPKVFVVEYNPSLPPTDILFQKFSLGKHSMENKRFYGASVAAWLKLFSPLNYSLIHVSGFCNLFFVKNEFKDYFQSPDVLFEITDTREKVLSFAKEFCLPGFIPSWFHDPPLTNEELNLLRQ